MRFRAKFGFLGWAYIAMALFALLLKISPGRPSEVLGLFAILWTVFAALRILFQIFIYWDLDSSGLHEQRLWGKRNVAWQEVTRVSAWNPKQPASATLAVDFARPAPMSDRGRVIANPENHQRFLAELRRYAPQAIFEV